MVDKTAFTPDEWNTVLASPMLAGMAVTLGEPSGLWGTMKEGMASATALLAAKNDPGANALAKAIVTDFETPQGRTAARDSLKADLAGKSAAEIKAQVIQRLGRVAQIIDAKAPADAPGFKAWLNSIAEKVAEASTEGGFLGFGGVKVSDAEKATLAEIAAALKA
ncbi:MAG: hypothetical protein U1E46_09265 [Hyphomicrobiales bacterium]